ncbi:tyrosine/lipid phosphatase LipA [Lactovum odontotermitis]
MLKEKINLRDLGGLKTSDGKTVQSRRLLRAAELSSLNESEQSILTDQYKLKVVVDFRTHREMKKHPDPQIIGVTEVKAPVMDDDSSATSVEEFAAAQSEDYLIAAYKGFVTDDFSRKAYTEFFKVLLNNQEGATLWHCAVGKDRTGFGAALILSALGVPETTIMEDYLLTNVYRQKENQSMFQRIAETGDEKQLDVMKALMEAREVYLDTAFSQIGQDFGSVDGYLKEGLSLTKDDLVQLKHMYLY